MGTQWALFPLLLLSTVATAEPYPTNPDALTNPGSYGEFKVLPEGKYRDEVLERVQLPGGRPGFRSRYNGRRGKSTCVYELTAKGDLLRHKATAPGGYLRFKPPLLSLPNLDRTEKWTSTSNLIYYSTRYPKGHNLNTATQSGRVLGPETVTVPAGTFKCLKVEIEFTGESSTQWYARGVGPVKIKVGPKEYLLVRYSPGTK